MGNVEVKERGTGGEVALIEGSVRKETERKTAFVGQGEQRNTQKKHRKLR